MPPYTGNTMIDCDLEYTQRDIREQARQDKEFEPEEDSDTREN